MASSLMTNEEVTDAIMKLAPQTGSLDANAIEIYIDASDAYVRQQRGPHPPTTAPADESAEELQVRTDAIAQRRTDIIRLTQALLMGEPQPPLVTQPVVGYGILSTF